MAPLFERFFFWWGCAVASHPWKVIAATLVITGLGSLGLLNFKAELFGDVDFAERALLNLARKVSSDRPSSGMADWVAAVSCRDPTTPCVPVSRPKDGRSVVRQYLH